MPKPPDYYAIIDGRATVEDPAGLARRRYEEGGFSDEALAIDLTWKFTPLVAEWERGESSPDLAEVSSDEAERIIERLRTRWASAD
ncbi:MAG: hypothetical protein ABJB47_01440 [Actinomycetota bacterium]